MNSFLSSVMEKSMLRLCLLAIVLLNITYMTPAKADNVHASYGLAYDKVKGSDSLTGTWTTFSDMLNP